MPAYRSSAEAEVRDAVVARLRALRPNARIMHEVNASSYGNRIDVLAVDRAEIIAVEVKSAKDKLDRLADQLSAMRGCAHHAVAALHEKFLIEAVTNKWASHYERDGVFYCRAVPEGHGIRYGEAWVYPERERASRHEPESTWRDPEPSIQKPLPAGALDMLWREELRQMCGAFGISAGRNATMAPMVAALRWGLTGRELTLGICAALRSRACAEADPAIEWSLAA